MNSKISADHLKRRAIVYIRQSSPGQVIHNQESQRRQYGLADHARKLGFQQVKIIDEDLGRSGSGQVERPGFQHLVAEVCTGQGGAVLCIEAPVWPATVETGITLSNSADWCEPS
jgi:DNA invertase Pin-like site-specific DNA recombinase